MYEEESNFKFGTAGKEDSADDKHLVKHVDVKRTLAYLEDNPVLSVFALGELTLNPDFLKMNLIKLNGFFFILRIALYQLIISALPFLPVMCTSILFITELSIFSLSLTKYIKHKHFKREILLIQKICQSSLISGFLAIVLLLSLSESSDPRSLIPVPMKR